MTIFAEAVDHTLLLEGGFGDDPQDPGGATNWGITIGVLRAWSRRVLGAPGTLESLKHLTREDAVKLYKARYWDVIKLDDVAEIDADVAKELFDTGVNMGPATGVKFLQRLLNVLNNRGQHYEEIDADGGVGEQTLGALRAYRDRRGEDGMMVLVAGLNCMQGARYVSIAENREDSEKFVYGWLKNRVVV